MKKLFLFAFLIFLNINENSAQTTIQSTMIQGPIGNLIPRPNPRQISSISCISNGISITTGGTTIAEYIPPTNTNNDNCIPSASFSGMGNWTGGSSIGVVTYSFSQPVMSVTVGYSAINSNDVGRISINGINPVLLSNPCGVNIINNTDIACNYTEGTYGDITITVSSITPFTSITLTNIGGQTGWVNSNPCNFIINSLFINSEKIYFNPLCYHATQNQTTTFSLFNAHLYNPPNANIPCTINGVPCNSSNVIIETITPMPYNCTFDQNGIVTIPAGTLPFYEDVYYRLRSVANPFHVSDVYRASFGIAPKVLPANTVIYLDADSQPSEVYDNGSASILFGDVSSQINTSITGVCGYIPALIDQPTISNTVTVIETTNPQNPYYRINTSNGLILFRAPYSESNPPPAPILPETNYFLTYQMCINNTGAVSFCETGVVTINHYYNANRPVKSLDKEDINIYPNPSSDGIFTLSLNKEHSEIKLEVYDMYGKNVYNEEAPISKDYSINLNNFSKGIYLLKIKQGDEVVNKNIVIK